MKKSELKQLIKEVVQEAFFNRNPDYVDAVEALENDPTTSQLWNKLQHGKADENDMNNLVLAAYRLGLKKMI